MSPGPWTTASRTSRSPARGCGATSRRAGTTAATTCTTGYPLHSDGASTAVPGLHFVGVHFLRKRKSSLLIGVGEDAAIVAGQIAAG